MRIRTLGLTGTLMAAAFAVTTHAIAADPSPAAVHWLDASPPVLNVGVSFGVPWPRGTVQKGQAFDLKSADGAAAPVQTWPLA